MSTENITKVSVEGPGGSLRMDLNEDAHSVMVKVCGILGCPDKGANAPAAAAKRVYKRKPSPEPEAKKQDS